MALYSKRVQAECGVKLLSCRGAQALSTWCLHRKWQWFTPRKRHSVSWSLPGHPGSGPELQFVWNDSDRLSSRMIVRPGWCPSQKMPRHIIYGPSSREKGVERRNAPRNTRYLSAFRTASSGVVPKHHQSTPKLYGRPRITTYHRARPLCLYGAVTKGVTTASLYFIQCG